MIIKEELLIIKELLNEGHIRLYTDHSILCKKDVWRPINIFGNKVHLAVWWVSLEAFVVYSKSKLIWRPNETRSTRPVYTPFSNQDKTNGSFQTSTQFFPVNLLNSCLGLKPEQKNSYLVLKSEQKIYWVGSLGKLTCSFRNSQNKSVSTVFPYAVNLSE